MPDSIVPFSPGETPFDFAKLTAWFKDSLGRYMTDMGLQPYSNFGVKEIEAWSHYSVFSYPALRLSFKLEGNDAKDVVQSIQSVLPALTSSIGSGKIHGTNIEIISLEHDGRLEIQLETPIPEASQIYQLPRSISHDWREFVNNHFGLESNVAIRKQANLIMTPGHTRMLTVFDSDHDLKLLKSLSKLPNVNGFPNIETIKHNDRNYQHNISYEIDPPNDVLNFMQRFEAELKIKSVKPKSLFGR